MIVSERKGWAQKVCDIGLTQPPHCPLSPPFLDTTDIRQIGVTPGKGEQGKQGQGAEGPGAMRRRQLRHTPISVLGHLQP
jgi:hypothetical protein